MPPTKKKRKKKPFPYAWCAAGVAVPVALVVVWLVVRAVKPKTAAAREPEPAAVQPAAPEKKVAAAAPDKGEKQFKEQIRPFLTKYCGQCHNDNKVAGDITLEHITSAAAAAKERKLLDAAREVVSKKEMPPKDKPHPSDAERKIFAEWVETTLTNVDCGLARDPGRPTIRRLNRAEYNNTIRDLVGVNFQPAEDFPSDDVGYGFDNIGDVLTLPPLLFEKYMAAAEKIVEQALVVEKPITAGKDTFRPQNFRSSTFLRPRDIGRQFPLTSNGKVFVNFEFLYGGDYVLRGRAYGVKAGDENAKMTIQLDGKALKTFDVDVPEGKAKTFETRTHVGAGRHDVELAFTNAFEDKDKKKRALHVELLEIEGPFNPEPKPLPESHKKIMVAKPGDGLEKEAAARKILERFATRAYRRPAQKAEVDRLVKLFKMADAQGDPFAKSVGLALRAVLVSPNFLFRIEKDAEPENPRSVHPVSDYELATRLSYFLWSTMPDDELFALADKGQLRKPGVVEAQVKRMLADPKARALTDNFAAQWLNLRMLAGVEPDRKTYPGFDPALKTAMVRETELFFEHVVKEDRSVLEFLDANYTFVNARLAKHYGLSGVTGSEFRKVTLTDKNRGGVITQASVLTLTSNPTRTSPVKRGKWILENILGTPPPPPPPDVPELEEKKGELTGSLRQRMEQHRANPSCASCHQKMDPLGFGLENFDGVGGWRAADGKFPIDPSGTLPGGERFNGPEGLRKILLGKAGQFRRNLAEKMLTYAIGRGLEYYDKCAVDDVAKKLTADKDRFSALVIGVVKSDPFQKRRGGSRE
jgi:mono/diheme cytochrome c family protein